MCSDPLIRATPGRRRAALLPPLALLLALTAAGCGNERPPKPPPRMVPAATADLEVAQRGSELQFAFTYPAVTIGGLALPGVEAVELWRLRLPLGEPAPGGEELDDEAAEEPAADDPAADEPQDAESEAPPQPAPLLFRRPAPAPQPAESRIQFDPRQFSALAALEQRIEGAELEAAISGDRVLLRLPLGELPAPEVPEDERELELFAVKTVSTRGLASQLSNVVPILPRTPPAAPQRIETRASADGIEVAWEGEDPPIGFRVYRRDAASRTFGTPIAQPAPGARSHLDRTAAFDARYVYSVTSVAREAPLLESALAGEREVHYEDRYPPAPPAGLLALAEPRRVRLLWEPSADRDLAGYLLYRRDADSSGFARLTAEPGLELDYLDDSVASGRAYSYYVSAVDRSGNESEASETVDVEVP